MVAQGAAGHGKTRDFNGLQGAATVLCDLLKADYGSALRGMAWRGWARRGAAGRGQATQDKGF